MNKKITFLILFLLFNVVFAQKVFSKAYAGYMTVPAIVARDAVEGTENIRILAPAGQVIIAKDADTDTTLGLCQTVTGNWGHMPLVSALTSGQKIYLYSTTSGLSSATVTVETTIGPYLAGGLRDGDTTVRGLGGSASAGSKVEIVNLTDELIIIGSGTINSNGTFEISVTGGVDDDDSLVPLTNGIIGESIDVESSGYKGPTIEWPVNANSTVIKGIGGVGDEVRVYDTNDLATVVASADVESDKTWSAEVSKTYTTQGNTLAVIGTFLGGIITVGSSGGPGIENTKSNTVSHGDTQVTGTGTAGEKVYLEKLIGRDDMGSGTVGGDSKYSINLPSALNGADRIVAVENNISSPVVTVAQGGDTVIVGEYGNYPNPFDPNSESTTIEYTLSNPTDIEIHIYDLNAVEVKVFECSATTEGGKAGKNQMVWNGVDGYGVGLSTGVYFYRIYGESKVLGRGKMAIVRY